MDNIGSDSTYPTADRKTSPAPGGIRRDLHALTRNNVELSAAEGPEDWAPQRKPATTLKSANRLPRILMVEDNWDHAYLALRALTVDGRYQVELVSSGAEALYKLTTGKFSLILLDYCLSGMSGLDLIRKIKELGQDVPIVMLTGLGSEAVAVEAMKMGAYDYVIKSGNYLAKLPLVIDKSIERYDLKKVKEHWDHWVLKRNRELGSLNTVGGAITQSLDTQTVIAAAVEKMTEILEADYGKIYLREAFDQTALPADDDGPAEQGADRVPSIIRQVAESGEPLVIENVNSESADADFEQAHGFRSSVYVPLCAKQEILGVLVIGSRKRGQYTSEDTMFYHALGNQIAVAIENARLYEALKSQTDRLRQFETKYRALIEGGSRDAVFIIQGNSFRYINRQAGQILGYTLEELYELHWLDLIAPADRELALNYLARVAYGDKTHDCEVQAIKKGDDLIHLSLSASRIEFDQSIGVQVVAHDISGQKRKNERVGQA